MVKYILLLLVSLCSYSSCLVIETKARSKLSAVELQDFISRPINWPQIVASSDRVESSSKGGIEAPMKPGTFVKEYFGLELLSVDWICRESSAKKKSFLVESPQGVPGIAKDCSMKFDFQDNEVTLKMGYTPESPLALLATPVLIVDNWIALNVLLPAAVDTTPLDSFRKLMGSLYGVAGLAHLVDIIIGNSVLFTSAGIPIFWDLPVLGQLYALLWCLVGPLSFWASRQQSSFRLADGGLILYGLVEVFGACLSMNSDALINAVVVQGIVLAAWWYSYQKQNNQ